MNIRHLSGKLLAKSENELNEVPNRILDDLKDIEEWLSKQPHLSVRKDPQWLLTFLRNCKFSLQRTKEKLDFFYTIKSITPEFFTNKDPMLPVMQEILKAGVLVPITKTTDKAGFPTIVLISWKYADPNKMHFTDLFKVGLMIVDILLNKNDNFTVNGMVILNDMADFSLTYATHLTPAICKKAAISITKAYPARIKGIYYINSHVLYETVINIFRSFLSEKLKNRFKVFGESSFDKLLEDIPLSVLPKDYGGEGETLHEINAEWNKEMEHYRDWFLEDAQYFSDETKRPGKPQTSADIFGVEGSFRKLNVD